MLKKRKEATEVNRLIRTQIQSLNQNAHKSRYFRLMASSIKKDRRILYDQIFEIMNQSGRDKRDKYNESRDLIFRHALNKIPVHLYRNIFRLSKHELIPYEILTQYHIESVIDNHVSYKFQNEVFEALIQCAEFNESNIMAFFKLFSDDYIRGKLTNTNSYSAVHGAISKHYQEKKISKNDISLRFRSMVWFIYLLIDIVTLDGQKVCELGPGYLKKKLKELLNAVDDEQIVKMDETGYDDGKWEECLFAYLQGDEKKSFVNALRKQFNFNEDPKNINRKLKNSIRQCLYGIVFKIICIKKNNDKE